MWRWRCQWPLCIRVNLARRYVFSCCLFVRKGENSAVFHHFLSGLISNPVNCLNCASAGEVASCCTHNHDCDSKWPKLWIAARSWYWCVGKARSSLYIWISSDASQYEQVWTTICVQLLWSHSPSHFTQLCRYTVSPFFSLCFDP